MLRKLLLSLALALSLGALAPPARSAGIQTFSNNAVTTLAAPVSSSATTITVSSTSAFPTLSGGNWFIATLEHLVSGVVTAQEIVKVTADSSNTWTVARAQENSAATIWVAGDTVALLPTAGGLSQFVQAPSAQAQGYNYSQDTGSLNSYQVTLSPALTAYVIGMPIVFKASSTNSGASSFNAGAGASALVMPYGQLLKGGEIQAGGIYTATWDGTYFELTAGAEITPAQHAYFEFQWNQASNFYYKIASLPVSAIGSADTLHIIATLNSGYVASNDWTVDVVMGNRGGFSYYYSIYGPISAATTGIIAYQESNGTVSVYAAGTQFAYANVSIINVGNSAYSSNGNPVGPPPTIYLSPPNSSSVSGTLVFNSSNPTTYPPLLNATTPSTYINSTVIAQDYATLTGLANETTARVSGDASTLSSAETFASTAATAAQNNAESFAGTAAATAQSNAESFASTVASTAQSNAEAFTTAGFVADNSVGTTQVTQLGATSGIGTGYTSVTFNIPVVGGASYALVFDSDFTTSGVTALSTRIAVTTGSGAITVLGTGMCLEVNGAGGGGNFIYAQNNAAGTTGISVNGGTPHAIYKGAFSVGASVTSVAFQIATNTGTVSIPAGGFVSLLRTN